MDDFVNAIAYEVKLEIANRYFGFRTRIEAEIGQYLEELHNVEKGRLAEIRRDFLRMRFLLHQEKFFKEFLLIARVPQNFAVDGSGKQPPPGATELFAGMKGEGFSRWRKFRDLAFRIYRSLGNNVAAYLETHLDLGEEHAEICLRIDEFHRNNDLSGILSFLRTFDSADNERLKFLHADAGTRQGSSLEQDLRIPHPRPVTDLLPALTAIPPLKEVKNPFNALLKSAFPNSTSILL